MTKLNQIVAVEKGVKTKAERAKTAAYHAIQKTPLFSGIARSYQPKDDDGDQLPNESVNVQLTGADVLETLGKDLQRLFDVTLTKETANASATADVVVDGSTVLADVPVTYLLFLEKQLVDLRTFVGQLPVLDPAETWTPASQPGVFENESTQTVKTKKVPRNWVRAEATQQHPAQVEVFHEDVVVGTWTTKKFSGALTAARVSELAERVDDLIVAVKFAREEANTAEVQDVEAGAAVFSYLFS